MLGLKNEENRKIHSTDGKGKGEPQMFLGMMGAFSHSSAVPFLGQLISQWTPRENQAVSADAGAGDGIRCWRRRREGEGQSQSSVLLGVCKIMLRCKDKVTTGDKR